MITFETAEGPNLADLARGINWFRAATQIKIQKEVPMKGLTILAVIGAFHLLLGLPLSKAQSSCPRIDSTLNATYGWLVEEGLIAQSAKSGLTVGDFVPFGTAGYFTFDGSGNVSGTHHTNFGGVFFERPDTGTYSVNLDCTGSISIPNNGLT